MRKYKNIIIVIAIILLVGFGTFFLSEFAKDKHFREISYENYENLLSSSNETMIYVGSKKDEESLNSVKNFAKENGLSFKYLNTDELTKEQLTSVYGESEITSEIIFVGDNSIKDSYTSKFETNSLLEFFISKKIVLRKLTDISLDTYVKMVQSKDSNVIFIGRDTCHYCELFHPVADAVVKEYDVPIYYLNTDTFINDDWSTFTATEKFYSEESWGTPLTVLITNGEIVDYINGYVEKEELVNFLTKNGVIK